MPCPYCGHSISKKDRTCPTCGNPLGPAVGKELLLRDVAHAGETWEQARGKIDQALSDALLYGHSGVRIIHGRGDLPGHTGIIAREAVRYLEDLARGKGWRLEQERRNPGAHILYF